MTHLKIEQANKNSLKTYQGSILCNGTHVKSTVIAEKLHSLHSCRVPRTDTNCTGPDENMLTSVTSCAGPTQQWWPYPGLI